jgi:segregation and condensation protein B
MDEISRELPADASQPRAVVERTKGPDEFAAFDRGIAAEDLVVNEPGAPRRFVADEPADRFDRSVPADAGYGEPAAAAPSHEEESPGRQPSDEVPSQDVPAQEIGSDELAAAIAAEASTVEIEDEPGDVDAEGLPAVPELSDPAAIARILFVLVQTQREGLSILRLAQACNTTQKQVEQGLEHLRQHLQGADLPVELVRTGDSVKLLSRPEAFPYLQRLRGVKKLEKLSPAALETLAVIAYRQPVMRSEIEAIRGVKAGPMLRMLLQHKLVKVTGRADVPGRPLQYGTTQQFLERFGLESLAALPSIKEFKNLG